MSLVTKGFEHIGCFSRELAPDVLLDASEVLMKYILAWALGVPGVVVLLWFLMAHH
jgi:hypothetical protein